MRVIAGEFRSRRLNTLPGRDVRPTPDRLRESLFSILASRLPGAVFLDGYAGTGSVGIEALSRGAARAIFIEKQRPVLEVLKGNLAALGIQDRGFIAAGPVTREIALYPADIVFLDPPYPLEGEYSKALEILGRNPPPIAIVQHSSRFAPGENHGKLTRTRTLRQGDNTLSFYTPCATIGTESE